MKMVERVARAIYAEFENRPAYAQLQMNGVLAEELALAALTAMREPNRTMIRAMDEYAGTIAPEHAYEAAIDAAISEATQKEKER